MEGHRAVVGMRRHPVAQSLRPLPRRRVAECGSSQTLQALLELTRPTFWVFGQEVCPQQISEVPVGEHPEACAELVDVLTCSTGVRLLQHTVRLELQVERAAKA